MYLMNKKLFPFPYINFEIHGIGGKHQNWVCTEFPSVRPLKQTVIKLDETWQWYNRTRFLLSCQWCNRTRFCCLASEIMTLNTSPIVFPSNLCFLISIKFTVYLELAEWDIDHVPSSPYTIYIYTLGGPLHKVNLIDVNVLQSFTK